MTIRPDQGLIALVCYVPEPLFSALRDIRVALNSSYSALPHITVLPPRPLSASADAVLDYVEAILSEYSVFAIELTHLSAFPATNVLYLEVDTGSDQLRQMHTALDTGELNYPETYEFTPHVTVAGPFESDALPGLFKTANELWALNDSSSRFEVRELVMLGLGPGESQWVPLRSFTLKRERGLLATAANQT